MIQVLVGVGGLLCVVLLLYWTYVSLHTPVPEVWPPMTAQCPDYWELSADNHCINPKQLGSCAGPVNFNTSLFQGSQGACNKYTWATKCGVAWDGVTYGVKSPCQP